MECDNCRAESDLAFTLAAYPENGNAVMVDFCSIDCLQDWTSTDSLPPEEWSWGVQELERPQASTPSR